ncbi:MAG TPA: D-aminoacylase [Armatimonadaceae bacterium]|nr:D-aminoacylase [Armatimonadaceae bacterium]
MRPGESPDSFDLVLRGGTVYDGTGASPVRADVGISGDRVAAVGDLSGARAGRVLDVRGKAVAPGFIDIHTHSDLTVLFTPGMESSLHQGVTSEVVGNCGISLGLSLPTEAFSLEQRGTARAGVTLDWKDLGGFLRRVEENGVAINVATLAGHGSLRKRAMGLAARRPDDAEMRNMLSDLETALEQGAVGLSSGLEYVPGMYADVEEMVPLARVAAAAGGFYATHIRDEGDAVEEAVAEAIEVAERAGAPLQLSHHKAERARNWGKVARTLAQVDAARERGLDVLLDQYPYTAYQTGLATVALPPWAGAGTPEALADRLRHEPDLRERARVAMADNGVDYASVEIANSPGHPEYAGRTVAALAADRGQDPRDFVLDLLAEGEGWVSAAHFALADADVERILSDPRVMVGSDAVASTPLGPNTSDRPHPRTYGTFARVLSRYVREKHVLTLEEAIRRMTSLPALRLGWRDRGRLAPGAVADIVVFDPATIADVATFDAPHVFPTGIEHVLVAGTLALEGGVATGARPGRILRRNAAGR